MVLIAFRMWDVVCGMIVIIVFTVTAILIDRDILVVINQCQISFHVHLKIRYNTHKVIHLFVAIFEDFFVLL
jgi:hypothetical protein